MDNRKKLQRQVGEIEESLREKTVKDHLKISSETRFKTSFIHAIAKVEEMFGHLWDEESEEEIEGPEFYSRLFQEFRKSVLDNGNKQIRAFNADLEHYNISLRIDHGQ